MNRLLVGLVLAGCVAPGRPVPPPYVGPAARMDAEWRSWRQHRPAVANGFSGVHLETVSQRGLPDGVPGLDTRPAIRRVDLVGETSPTSDLTGHVTGATFDMTTGQALAARLAQFSSQQVSQYGVALLTEAEQFGDDTTPGLCESPALQFDFDADDTRYEARMEVNTYSHFPNEPYVPLVPLPDACVAGLATTKGDVDAAVASGACDEGDILGQLTEGTDCRECVEDDAGDYDGCITAGRCAPTAQAYTWVQEGPDPSDHGYYPYVVWYLLACAPDWYDTVFVMYTPLDDGSLPGYWDSEHWAYTCEPFWVDDVNDVRFDCEPGAGGPKLGDTVSRGMFGFASYLRPKGSSGTPWANRRLHLDSLETTNHIVFTDTWATVPGYGAVALRPPAGDEDPWMVSAWGAGKPYAWNLNPTDLRPDGQDKARDYLAALAMKTTTSINGVLVEYANHDRCDPAAWHDLGDGTSFCDHTLPADPAWAETPETELDTYGTEERWWSAPMLTLASSGLPDPAVPGGLATLVVGSPSLQKLEGCTYPATFLPDVVRYEDEPGTDGGHALVGQTWRFGKDDLGIVGVMSTNRVRGFCPSGP